MNVYHCVHTKTSSLVRLEQPRNDLNKTKSRYWKTSFLRETAQSVSIKTIPLSLCHSVYRFPQLFFFSFKVGPNVQKGRQACSSNRIFTFFNFCIKHLFKQFTHSKKITKTFRKLKPSSSQTHFSKRNTRAFILVKHLKLAFLFVCWKPKYYQGNVLYNIAVSDNLLHHN